MKIIVYSTGSQRTKRGLCRKARSNPPVSTFRWGKCEIYEVVRLTWSKRRGQKKNTHNKKRKKHRNERGQKLFMCLERVCTLTRSASICNPPCGHMCGCVCVGAYTCVWVRNVTRIKLLPMLNCHSAHWRGLKTKRLGWVPETTLVKRL